ncbi:MAG: hypothetical protein JRH15_12450 [Deltaproteobacteria bacterium]|nr:hypothetical protein [Deltaproteobacteria bacterium]
MNDISSRQYSSDDVNRIIRRALKIKQNDSIAHEDLLNTANEAGLDSQTIENAVEQEMRDHKKTRSRESREKHRKAVFHRHKWSYIIVIGGRFRLCGVNEKSIETQNSSI